MRQQPGQRLAAVALALYRGIDHAEADPGNAALRMALPPDQDADRPVAGEQCRRRLLGVEVGHGQVALQHVAVEVAGGAGRALGQLQHLRVAQIDAEQGIEVGLGRRLGAQPRRLEE